MKKPHITATALLLTAALLLSGCTERNSAPASDPDTSTTTENLDNNNSTTSESSSSSEIDHDDQNNEEDNIDQFDYSALDMAAISNEMDSWYESLLAEYDAYVDDLFTGLDEVRETGDVPVEYTDKDLELQAILMELDRGVRLMDILTTVDGPFYRGENGYMDISPKIFIQDEGESHRSAYSIIPDNYRLESLPVPTTAEEMRALVMEYFTKEIADNFMDFYVAKGSLTENPDGTYSVTVDENGKKPLRYFMELDGRLYWQGWAIGGRGFSMYSLLCRSAKVLSWTEDTIEFSYLDDVNLYYDDFRDILQSELSDVTRYEENAKIGVLKYERGGWRRDYNKEKTN